MKLNFIHRQLEFFGPYPAVNSSLDAWQLSNELDRLGVSRTRDVPVYGYSKINREQEISVPRDVGERNLTTFKKSTRNQKWKLGPIDS